MVGLSSIKALIASLHGIEPEAIRGLDPRFRHLNEDRFPPGHRVGPAKRADYDAEDILAFSVQFALADAFIPPVVATGLIRDCWPEIASACVVAAAELGIIPAMTTAGGSTLLIHPHALVSARAKAGERGRGVGHGDWDVAVSREGAADADEAAPLGAVVVIDLVRRLSAMLERGDETILSSLRAGLPTIASRQFRPPAVDLDKLRLIDTAGSQAQPSGERLGEADYFFARAIRLVEMAENPTGMSEVSRRAASRMSSYLASPVEREGWKRWIEVRGTGIPFLWALSTYLHLHHLGPIVDLPATLSVSIESRLAMSEGDGGRGLLLSTAERGRTLRPATD